MIFGGIDAGGTATECILLTEEGGCLAHIKTGPANYLSVGLDNAVEEIHKAVKIACEKAGVKKIDILGLGLAGAGRPENIKRFSNALLPLEQVENVFLTDDGKIALLGAHAGDPGVIVIAGTGSIVYGMLEDGNMVRAGGWGYVLGDEGSGFWIGLEAIKRVIRADEGRGLKTSLHKVLMEKLKLTDLNQLVSFVYGGRLPREKIASLAPQVIKEGEDGDKVAREIIDNGLAELALTVQGLIKKMNGLPGKIAVSGGLFSNSLFFNLFSSKILQLGDFDVVRPLYDPVHGAVFYGIKKAGIKNPLIS